MRGSLCHQRVNVTSVVKRFEPSADREKKCRSTSFLYPGVKQSKPVWPDFSLVQKKRTTSWSDVVCGVDPRLQLSILNFIHAVCSSTRIFLHSNYHNIKPPADFYGKYINNAPLDCRNRNRNPVLNQKVSVVKLTPLTHLEGRLLTGWSSITPALYKWISRNCDTSLLPGYFSDSDGIPCAAEFRLRLSLWLGFRVHLSTSNQRPQVFTSSEASAVTTKQQSCFSCYEGLLHGKQLRTFTHLEVKYCYLDDTSVKVRPKLPPPPDGPLSKPAPAAEFCVLSVRVSGFSLCVVREP